MAKVEKDFVELLKLFNRHGVRYCIVGAFAVAFHAIPRYTKDLDVLVEPTEDNGKRICLALRDFGFGNLNILPQDFSKKGRFIQLGYEPVRVDLITSVAGLNFQKVWANRKLGRYGVVRVPFINLPELIQCKRAAHRKQDLADLEILEKARRKNR